MSKPLTLGERAQPGRPSTGLPSSPAEQQQIAGIDRHAEMLDRAAGRHDARRDDVAAIDDRRGAGDQQEIAILGLQLAECGGDGVGVVRAAALADQGCRATEPLPVVSDRLVEDLVLEPGRRVWTKPTPHRLEGRDRTADGWPRAPARPRPLTAARGAAKGMIFTVATIWLGSTRAKGWQRGQGHRLVEDVERVDALAGRSHASPASGRSDWSGR